MLDALFQSLIIFFLAEASYWDSTSKSNYIIEKSQFIHSQRLFQIFSWHLGIRNHHNDVLFDNHARAWCHRNQVMGMSAIAIENLKKNSSTELYFQTILHVLSMVLSLGSFYLFALVYNTLCVKCFKVPSQYWVIQRCMSSPIHWLLIILTAVVCVLPR